MMPGEGLNVNADVADDMIPHRLRRRLSRIMMFNPDDDILEAVSADIPVSLIRVENGRSIDNSRDTEVTEH